MEQLRDADYNQIISILENKIPQEKIISITMAIKAASDIQDHGDSPYNRPTFAKIVLLTILIISILAWLVIPVYKLLFASNDIKSQENNIVTERKLPTSDSFAFNIVLDKTSTDKPIISVFDKDEKELLAKRDILNNKAYVLSSRIDNYQISTSELQILRSTNADLTEDIKDDVLGIIAKNITVKDTYLNFKPIDLGVDQIINVQQ